MPPEGGATINDLIVSASQSFTHSDSPRLDAQLLMGHALGKDRAWLIAHGAETPTSENQQTFEALAARCRDGEPIAYLLGSKPFWDRDFLVTPDTLVPRPETELLIELILAECDDAPRVVVDLGTGTGCIAAVLAAERPNWLVVGVDINEATLAVARQNCAGAVPLLCSSWLDGFGDSSIDIVVSNPPYIRDDDPHLSALRYEPQRALVSGRDGLDDVRMIAEGVDRCLKPDGLIVVEHGYDQQPAVRQLLEERGYATTGHDDASGNARAVTARRN